MTTEQFMQDLENYFGCFANDIIAKRYFSVANTLTAESVANVFEWLLCNVPVTFRLDIKTLQDALAKTCVSYKETGKNCPCCGGLIKRNQSFCYSCGYDYSCPPEKFERASDADFAQVFSNLHLLRFDKKTG